MPFPSSWCRTWGLSAVVENPRISYLLFPLGRRVWSFYLLALPISIQLKTLHWSFAVARFCCPSRTSTPFYPNATWELVLLPLEFFSIHHYAALRGVSLHVSGFFYWFLFAVAPPTKPSVCFSLILGAILSCSNSPNPFNVLF